MSKALFFALCLALVAVAYAALPLSAEEKELAELTDIIRMGKMCPCKCLVSKRGKKAVKKVCSTKRRMRDCEVTRCVKKSGKKGRICCNKVVDVTPEAEI